VKYAMNDLQNNVAKLGGNFVQHDTPQLGISGDKYGTTTSTATVSGTAYFCDPNAKRSIPAVAQAPAPQPTVTPVATSKAQHDVLTATPEGAGGFRFGHTVAEAQASCIGRGYKWKRPGSDAECSSSLVPVGTSARVVLHTCQEAICGIDVLVTEPPEKLIAKYDELYALLEQKYGIPRQKRAAVDAACSSNLVACISGPTAPIGAAWRWPDGNSLELSLTQSAGAIVVSLAYSNPARTQAVMPGPAL
jgi:hypothetical protein